MNTGATTPVAASSHFDEYRKQPEFAARLPDLLRQEYADEVNDLCADPQVSSLNVVPAIGIQYATVDFETDESDRENWLTSDQDNKYLWLVRPDDVKIAAENGALGRGTQRGRLSHTNLSGNTPAHCGGEFWFGSEDHVYVNGASSRFTPRGLEELVAVAKGFVGAGYSVCCFGWDDETGRPKRVLRRSEVKWL